MTTAVDSLHSERLEAKMNGHVNGGGALNGTGALNGDARRWEEQFLPPALRIDDQARAQKVTFFYYLTSLIDA